MAERIFRTRPAAACGTVLAERPSGGPYRRCLPTIAGPRPAWMPQDLWRHYYETVTPPPARLVLLREATVRGPGIVTLPGDVVVAESLLNTHHLDSIAGLRRTGPGSFAAEEGFTGGAPSPMPQPVLLKQMWDINYGHWLVEGLPRIGLLEGAADLAACSFVVSSIEGMSPLSAPMAAVIAESLGAFGVMPGQISASGWEPQVFDRLIYPLPLTEQPWVKAPFAIRVLESLAARLCAGQPAGGAPARIFLRRPPESRRELRGQDEIAARFAARGYAVLTPGEMSFTQQVRAFAGATHIAGVLGAECANLAFAPAGVRFLGFAPAEMQDDFFYDLVSHKDGAYFCLHGAAEAPGMNAAFSLDRTALDDIVRAFEAG